MMWLHSTVCSLHCHTACKVYNMLLFNYLRNQLLFWCGDYYSSIKKNGLAITFIHVQGGLLLNSFIDQCTFDQNYNSYLVDFF